MTKKVFGIILCSLLCVDVALAVPKPVVISSNNKSRLILTDERLPNKKPLVCYRKKPTAVVKPGWIKKILKKEHWVPFKRTKKNKDTFERLLARCRQAIPEPSECSAPAGYVGVSSAETFAALSNEHGRYFLCNDIILTGNLTPLFNNGIFQGVFDGNKKTIRGLRIEQPNQPSVGLFRVLQDATVKDLTIIEPVVRGRGVVGVLAGISSARILNVTIDGGTVNSVHRPAGGLVGVQFMGEIRNSSSTAIVTAGGESGDQQSGIKFP
jgi:hypothetical protein